MRDEDPRSDPAFVVFPCVLVRPAASGLGITERRKPHPRRPNNSRLNTPSGRTSPLTSCGNGGQCAHATAARHVVAFARVVHRDADAVVVHVFLRGVSLIGCLSRNDVSSPCDQLTLRDRANSRHTSRENGHRPVRPDQPLLVPILAELEAVAAAFGFVLHKLRQRRLRCLNHGGVSASCRSAARPRWRWPAWCARFP